eukprot:scaffold83528_cov30-Tisochrysis_lutea.AAC.1
MNELKQTFTRKPPLHNGSLRTGRHIFSKSAGADTEGSLCGGMRISFGQGDGSGREQGSARRSLAPWPHLEIQKRILPKLTLL